MIDDHPQTVTYTVRRNIMNLLSYETLKEIEYPGFFLEHAPEKILQFGEGNFLRAFAEYFIDILNEKTGFQGKVVVVKPRPARHPQETSRLLNRQQGLYTLSLQGMEKGMPRRTHRVISSISRCLNAHEDWNQVLSCAENPRLRWIISNTTEAGIVYDPECGFSDEPPASFPGKLTRLLYRRYQCFKAQPGMGLVLLPCELIQDNGKALEEAVFSYARQWNLENDFLAWLEKENVFCSTLVDRIVTGYPQQEAESLWKSWGYVDHCADAGEPYALWVIQKPKHLLQQNCAALSQPLLPDFSRAELPVIVTDDLTPFRTRKVRILNGSHTAMACGAWLAGKEQVRDFMEDPLLLAWLRQTLTEEILPVLPAADLKEFTSDVLERFRNPYIRHALPSICLNSVSKWKTRILPSLLDYHSRFGKLPGHLTASLAFLAAFYQGMDADGHLTQIRQDGASCQIQDEPAVIRFFQEHLSASPEELMEKFCRRQDFWGQDLTLIPEFVRTAARDLQIIRHQGARTLFEQT